MRTACAGAAPLERARGSWPLLMPRSKPHDCLLLREVARSRPSPAAALPPPHPSWQGPPILGDSQACVTCQIDTGPTGGE